MHNCSSDKCYCDICKTEITFPLDIDCTTVLHNCNVQEPSLFDKVLSFSSSCIKHVATGFKRASEFEIAERMNICNLCDYNQKNKCLLCGCPIVKKTSWLSQSCPDKKW